MVNFDDYIKWFHQHYSSTYNLVETAIPMVDIAMFTIKHIKRLCLSHVSEKVKSDFFKILLDYSKANGSLIVFFIEPIMLHLLNLIEDDELNVDNFITYFLSMPIGVQEQSFPLANLLEQGTLLTNNLSEHTKKFGQGNHKESTCNTQRIPLNRNLLMRKVYIQNWLLLLPILPRLNL
jgi:hypothetical protein